MKRLTRRQVAAWFEPINRALTEMKSDGVISINDFAVTRMNDGEYLRIDFCITGWVGCLSRIFPDLDVSPLVSLSAKLSEKLPVTLEEIDSALRVLKSVERPLIKMSWLDVKAACLDEQLAIELSRLGLA